MNPPLHTEKVTDDEFLQGQPAVHGSRVLWHDKRSGNFDIFLKDIVSGELVQVTRGAADEKYPSISEDLIAWVSGDHLWAAMIPKAETQPPVTPTPVTPPPVTQTQKTVKLKTKFTAKKNKLNVKLAVQDSLSLSLIHI